MSEPDVVDMLEEWLCRFDRPSLPPYPFSHIKTLRKARDEIVALRKDRQDRDNEIVASLVKEMVISVARGQALEEAARVCEGGYTTGSTASTLKAVAAAIRALKGKSE